MVMPSSTVLFVVLDNNSLTEIPNIQSTFIDVGFIAVSLQHNAITTITNGSFSRGSSPLMQTSASQVILVQLQFNRISSLPSQALNGHLTDGSLRIVMSDNAVSTIAPDAFDQVRVGSLVVHLERNNITSLPSDGCVTLPETSIDSMTTGAHPGRLKLYILAAQNYVTELPPRGMAGFQGELLVLNLTLNQVTR